MCFRCHNSWRWGELQPGAASTLLSGARIRAEEQYSDYGRGHCFYRHGYGVCVCVCSSTRESLRGRRKTPRGRDLDALHSIFKHFSPLASSIWINEACLCLIEQRTQFGSVWIIQNKSVCVKSAGVYTPTDWLRIKYKNPIPEWMQAISKALIYK